jgi:transcriptional regulator NrdR family protein
MNCPMCRKTKLELFEEDDYNDDAPVKRYTCNKCGIFVDIQNITDTEVLKMIDYKEDDKNE